MSQFLRLISEANKAQSLMSVCTAFRQGHSDPRHFELIAEAFDAIPGKPFAYWVSDVVRNLFVDFRPFANGVNRIAKVGLQTSDDDRFVRAWWEITSSSNKDRWMPFAKGESIGSYYGDISLVVGYSRADQLGLMRIGRFGRGADCYYRPGITWALRAARFSPRILPAGCIFSNRGQSCFASLEELPVLLAMFNSSTVDFIYKLSLGRFGYPEFLVGILMALPFPVIEEEQSTILALLGRQAWSLKRTLDSIEETSHAFLLPAALRSRIDDYETSAIDAELIRIQAQIDEIAFDLYDFSGADRAAVTHPMTLDLIEDAQKSIEDEDSGEEPPANCHSLLLSWAVGVAFGRFDWRLATGERVAPPEPEPFDPLPAKSPGMLPDGAEPFHHHPGILVDDPGHPHDLAHLVEEVLACVDVAMPDDVRRWLQREFFAFHLQRYSKSRRKAPIYWPLATASGSYTLWVYYPALTSQTLYTAINDFIEPKLKETSEQVAALRGKGSARTRDDEKQFEVLQAFELELIELRDMLLKLAPSYKPNHDDGVQICAAPLWPLFRYKPWQKVLKETWAKLEKGDFDWAHLAMNYWPGRVREKCKTDKSLAIAHGLEDLYIEPQATPKKARKRKGKEV